MKVYHPAGAYSVQDKKEFAEKVTAMYSRIPISKFYVVMIFEEVAAESSYVGGASHGKFVRLKLEHMARTLPEIPPPFESHAEKRWVKENKVSPYGLQEKLPVGAAASHRAKPAV